MVEENLHDIIEQYLLGQLSPPERARLEADIAIDPSLFEQVEIQRLALLGMQRFAATDLAAKFAQWDKEMDVPPPASSSPPTNRNPWVWTTATLLLLLIAGAFWHFARVAKVQRIQEQERQRLVQQDSLILTLRRETQATAADLMLLQSQPKAGQDSASQVEINRLREELDQKERVLRQLESQSTGGVQMAMSFAPKAQKATWNYNRSGPESGDSILTAAKKAYQNSDFNNAVFLLKSIPSNDLRHRQVLQHLPYALFYDQQFEAAVPVFLELLQDDPSAEMDIQWFLLLSYVALQNTTDTQQLLLAIRKNPKHSYYKEAGKLIKALHIK